MIRDAIRRGQPYPAVVANAPILSYVEIFYFTAYQELQTCRRLQGGYIPWDSIMHYAREYMHDVSELAYVILRIDDALMPNEKGAPDGQRPKQPKQVARKAK